MHQYFLIVLISQFVLLNELCSTLVLRWNNCSWRMHLYPFFYWDFTRHQLPLSLRRWSSSNKTRAWFLNGCFFYFSRLSLPSPPWDNWTSAGCLFGTLRGLGYSSIHSHWCWCARSRGTRQYFSFGKHLSQSSVQCTPIDFLKSASLVHRLDTIVQLLANYMVALLSIALLFPFLFFTQQ